MYIIGTNKKSKKGIKKKLINLYEKADDRNVYPLAIVLSKEEYKQISEKQTIISSIDKINTIKEDYYIFPSMTDEYNNVYMFLNIFKLQRDFYENKIYLTQFITRNKKIKYVKSMYHGDANGNPTELGVVTLKSL